MKIKNGNVYAGLEPLKKLSVMDLPVKVSYDLGRRIRKISEQYQAIEAERVKLVKKYSGETESVPPESMEAFIKDFNALLLIEEELDIQPIKIDALCANGNKCSAQDLIALDWLIQTDEPAKTP